MLLKQNKFALTVPCEESRIVSFAFSVMKNIVAS